jgi:hypothetical protein
MTDRPAAHALDAIAQFLPAGTPEVALPKRSRR